MSENDILPLMIKDHRKIDKLLKKLEETIGKDYEIIRESFNKFEWELEKHLFTEEKAIFTLYNPKDVSEGYKMLPELTKQHNYIINFLNNWRKDIRNKNKIEGFYEFKHFITNHRLFEEKEVYPKLDQSLDESQKKQIINRINEII
jgi:hemerythrin superfamily protein